MRPECENLRPRRKILFGKIPACLRREMQRHHTPATCWLRFGAATIILSAQSIVNVGTRLIGWKFCRKAHSFRLRSPPRTYSGSVAWPEYPISTPFLRKNHTPAVPLRQLQSPLGASCLADANKRNAEATSEGIILAGERLHRLRRGPIDSQSRRY